MPHIITYISHTVFGGALVAHLLRGTTPWIATQSCDSTLWLWPSQGRAGLAKRRADHEMRGLGVVRHPGTHRWSSTTHPGGLAFPRPGAQGPLSWILVCCSSKSPGPLPFLPAEERHIPFHLESTDHGQTLSSRHLRFARGPGSVCAVSSAAGL